MKISAIISDIDGTFIDDDGQLPEGVHEYYKEVTDLMGIPVHFATGRSFLGAKQRLAKLGLADKMKLTPGVYSDGCVIVGDKGIDEPLHVKTLDWDLMVEVDEFVERFRKEKGIWCVTTYETPKELYSQRVDNEYFDCLRDTWDMEFTPLAGDSPNIHTARAVAKLPIMAMSVVAHPRDMAVVTKALIDMLDGRATAMVTSPFITHITNDRLSKKEGVRTLCELMGYSEDEVLVLGDGVNDVSMLKHFPNSVAMGNAVPDAKQVAGYVGDHVTKQGWKKSIAHMLSVVSVSEPTTQVSTTV